MTAIHVSIAALAVTLLAQFGGAVWFAATIRATLTHAIAQLTRTTDNLDAAVRAISAENAEIKRDVAILQDRQDRPARELARPFRPPTPGV